MKLDGMKTAALFGIALGGVALCLGLSAGLSYSAAVGWAAVTLVCIGTVALLVEVCP